MQVAEVPVDLFARQNDEFVATNPIDVLLLTLADEPLCNQCQKSVSLVVSQLVIYPFQTIDINKGQEKLLNNPF